MFYDTHLKYVSKQFNKKKKENLLISTLKNEQLISLHLHQQWLSLLFLHKMVSYFLSFFKKNDNQGWTYSITSCFPPTFSCDYYYQLTQDPCKVHRPPSQLAVIRWQRFQVTWSHLLQPLPLMDKWPQCKAEGMWKDPYELHQVRSVF